MKIIYHTELLNALVKKHNLKSYLEIGTQKRSNNFNKIECDDKYCVDPDIKADADFIGTSDDFFEQNTRKFDLIFIDGLHHADQVQRDFENSLKSLNEGGFIAIHDVLPQNEVGTKVPRETLVWWGDVYKFAMSIRNHYSDIRFKTFNITNGLMIVWKEPGYTYTTFNEPMNWETYQKHGHELLDVVSNIIDEVEI